MKIYWLILMLLCTYIPVLAQRLVERETIVNPLFYEIPAVDSDEMLWMSSVNAWGGFGGYPAGDDEHAWYQKLGVLTELFRIGNHSSLSFESNIEFIANAKNDLGFNPRAMIWEEGFRYTNRSGNSFWQIGYFHRCKHEIENLDLGYERSLIFGGLYYKYILPVFDPGTLQKSFLALRAEIYTIRQDSRFPDEFKNINPNLNQLQGTISFNFNNQKELSKHFGFYLNSHGSFNFFGQKEGFFIRFNSLQTVQASGGISTGIAITGIAHFLIGLNLEYFSDTAINPIPEDTWLFSIGISVINPKIML